MCAHGSVYSVCMVGRYMGGCGVSAAWVTQGRQGGHGGTKGRTSVCSGGVVRKGKMERQAGWVAQWKRNKKKDLKDCGQSRSGEGSSECERTPTVSESELVEDPSLLP